MAHFEKQRPASSSARRRDSAARRSLQCAAALGLGLAALDCSAYLDPNAGGLLYQILLPVIVVVVGGLRYLRQAWRTLWRRLKGADPRLPPEDKLP
jgi:cation transport ATPase